MSQILKEFMNSLANILEGENKYMLVMDNLLADNLSQEFRDTFPFKIVYLPKFSPFLNPCQEVYSKLRKCIKREGKIVGTDDLKSRMENALSQVTCEEISIYILTSESFFEDCIEKRDILIE
ncbi:hypothetical protein RF11_06352 [Thelohanellus kitauei]|uniref:Tc1-like transposase DDE domain-containing protein n=1 Tax=Thelohanellus kitauei TaxID=669202 RepID=A0A0C2IJB2_THEKT|nr:hypothetical protein RF11_06352 [Thelohanellus kitauei]